MDLVAKETDISTYYCTYTTLTGRKCIENELA